MPFLALPLGRQLQGSWGHLAFLACAQPWADVAPDTMAERGLKRPWGASGIAWSRLSEIFAGIWRPFVLKAPVLAPPHLSANRATASSLCCWLKQVHLSWFSCCFFFVSHWPGTLPPAWGTSWTVTEKWEGKVWSVVSEGLEAEVSCQRGKASVSIFPSQPLNHPVFLLLSGLACCS